MGSTFGLLCVEILQTDVHALRLSFFEATGLRREILEQFGVPVRSRVRISCVY